MSAPGCVAIVGEDTVHAVLLCCLLRQVIREAARELGQEWIVENLIADPAFVGPTDLHSFIPGLHYRCSISSAPARGPSATIDGRPIKLRGHLDGSPIGPEGQKWRHLLLEVLSDAPDVVLIAKDTDGRPESLDGLRRVARYYAEADSSRVIVVAAPHRDAEGWLVAGFVPTPATHETKTLATVRRDLNFDPTTSPERLTSHPNDAPTDAKRVLRQLLNLAPIVSMPPSPEDCALLQERLLGDLALLRARNAESGLTTFLDDLTHHALPRLFGVLRPR